MIIYIFIYLFIFIFIYVHLIVLCCCVGVFCTSDAFHSKIRNDSSDQVCARVTELTSLPSIHELGYSHWHDFPWMMNIALQYTQLRLNPFLRIICQG